MSAVLIYLFHIKTKTLKEYCLTSGNNKIEHEGNIYLPYSGLSLASGEFNDSAENHIILHGIFEKNGIYKEDKLMGSSIKIMRLQKGLVKDYVTYICAQFYISDLEFEIRLEPETIKYNQSLLEMFSKTCRANFGDHRCKININDYAIDCEMVSFEENRLLCDMQNVEDGYFTGGKLITSDNKEFSILTHNNNNIEIETNDNHNITIQEQVKLIPACDKNFRTCCNRFNNAVNFRGEPSIPESNIVKN